MYINYNGLAYPMLHTKIRGNRPTGSGEEDFKRVLLFIAMAAIFVMWPGPFIKFRSLFLRMLHMKFGFDWPSGFRGEDI